MALERSASSTSAVEDRPVDREAALVKGANALWLKPEDRGAYSKTVAQITGDWLTPGATAG